MTEPTEEQRAAATAILNNTELVEAIAALIAERDTANRGRDAAKELAAQWGFRLAEAEEQRDMLSLRRGRGLPRSEVCAMTTHNEAAIERSVRAGCDAVDPHLRCSFPECGCKTNPRIVRAALAALLAEHDRRVTELLAANTAEVERRRAAEAECTRLSALAADIGRERLALAEELHAADFAGEVYCGERDATWEKLSAERRKREAAEALAERMWPIIEAVAGIKSPHDFAFTIFPTGSSGDDLIQTAAALVREREEKETES